MRVLKNYDLKKENVFTIEQLKEGMCFKINDGRIFIRGEKIRTRYKCKEIPTGKMYLFNGLYEVTLEEQIQLLGT